MEDGKRLKFAVSSYQHQTQTLGEDPLVIWIGDKAAVKQQLANMYDLLGLEAKKELSMTWVVNTHKAVLSPTHSSIVSSGNAGEISHGSVGAPLPQDTSGNFSVKDITL